MIVDLPRRDSVPPPSRLPASTLHVAVVFPSSQFYSRVCSPPPSPPIPSKIRYFAFCCFSCSSLSLSYSTPRRIESSWRRPRRNRCAAARDTDKTGNRRKCAKAAMTGSLSRLCRPSAATSRPRHDVLCALRCVQAQRCVSPAVSIVPLSFSALASVILFASLPVFSCVATRTVFCCIGPVGALRMPSPTFLSPLLPPRPHAVCTDV